jgi:adenosylcobinamide kinase/adenosylcobinamide-phosphate guanylyltransferase
MDGEHVYIATAQAFDEEMAERIAHHRNERDDRWRTVEAPIDLARAIGREARSGRVVLVDCLTLWTSNILIAGMDSDAAVSELVHSVTAAPCPIFVVSNEVGLGIVPENALARQFRDVAGRLHQQVAAAAACVELVVAGIPLAVKRP